MYVNVVISYYVCTSGMLEGGREGGGRTHPPDFGPSLLLAPQIFGPQV